jgi:RNA polymerase sigma-70 factor (ECF subfamily)
MRQIRTALASVFTPPQSDGDLLTRYVSAREESAFAELVRRLGPMVMGVCRRALGDTPDAEDAFQVTFMVLARKAGSVQPSSQVARWVYGVASLTARKARANRSRRREVNIDFEIDRPASEDVMDHDLARVLDEELGRLPEKLRLPVVLCKLRDLTVAQAADELGWPVGTVASRLSRGREALAARLTRRGVTMALALLAVGSLARTASAVVPPGLVKKTVTAAVTGGTGSSAVVQSLFSEVLRTMTVGKLRWLCMGLVAAVAFVAPGSYLPGAGVAARAAPAPATQASEQAEPGDALDRVKVERLAWLLRVEAVQKDLGLTDDQKKKLDVARAEAKSKRDAVAEQQVRDLVQKALRPVIPGVLPAPNVVQLDVNVALGIEAALEKEARDVLTPKQMRRLKQISLQARGPAVLLDRHVIPALGLSAAQEDKIETAVTPDPRQASDVARLLNGRPADEAAQQVEKAWDEAIKALTPSQRSRWDKLVGKMLSAAELQE